MTEEEKNEVYKKAFNIACSNRVLSFNDPAIDALFKAVKKALGNDVISRIEHSRLDKVILIPGNNNELVKGIVSYIWYTHPPVRGGGRYEYISLKYWNCSRLKEIQIEQDLTGWYLEMHKSRTPPLTPISPFRSNVDLTEKINLSDRWKSIWFLQNIKKGYLKVFERLLKIANEYKLGDERMLIVSTDKVNNLPEELKELKDQFEVIKLDAEKQDTTQEAIELKYDKNRHILFTNEKHLQLTQDKKILIKYLSEGRKAIDFLVEKLAESKGKNKLQYSVGNCRSLIAKTNRLIEKEFGIKEFVHNEKKQKRFLPLNTQTKRGNFFKVILRQYKGNIAFYKNR